MKKLFLGIAILVVFIVGIYFINGRVTSQESGGENLEYVTHTSKEFSFEYPKGWYIQDIQDNLNSFIQVCNFHPDALNESPEAIGNYFKVEIVRLAQNETSSLKSWVDNYIANQDVETRVVEERQTFIDGQEALSQIVEIVPLGAIHPVVFIKNAKKDIYILNISKPMEEFEPVLEKFLESFKFVE